VSRRSAGSVTGFSDAGGAPSTAARAETAGVAAAGDRFGAVDDWRAGVRDGDETRGGAAAETLVGVTPIGATLAARVEGADAGCEDFRGSGAGEDGGGDGFTQAAGFGVGSRTELRSPTVEGGADLASGGGDPEGA
jgi:hypothetical protein